MKQFNTTVASILITLTAVAHCFSQAASHNDQSLLAEEPFRAENIGLSFRPPVNAVVTSTEIGSNVEYIITDAKVPPRWRVRIQTMQPAEAETTADEQIENRLTQLRQSNQQFTLLADEKINTGRADGRLIYLQQNDEQKSINGFMLLPRENNRFIAFTIFTLKKHYETVRSILDASFATISVTPVRELIARRAERLARGREIVKLFTPEQLRSAIAEDRTWYRIYQPAGQTGEETEVGYFTIRCLEAERGQVDGTSQTPKPGSSEDENGLMVVIEARAVLDAEKNKYIDVLSRFWMSFYRDEETWSTTTTVRQGNAAQSFAETGLRSPTEPGYPYGTLTVIHSRAKQDGLGDSPKTWSIPDRAYLSMVENIILGQLLPRDGSMTTEPFAFYHYDPRQQKMTQQVSRWRKAGDSSGNWILTTRPSLDQPEVKQVFDETGKRIRRIDTDGSITVAIDPRQLQQLWRSKGLSSK